MQYAKEKQLNWIDDPSNFDIGYDRNYLRHHVTTQLQRRWPSYARILSRVAATQAETAKLCSALADIDRRSATGSKPDTLSIAALKRLSRARRNNLLRYWIHTCGLPMPSRTQLTRFDQDMIDSRPDSTPCLHWLGAELRRYREDLYAIPPLAPHDHTQEIRWNLKEELRIPHLGVTLNIEVLKDQGFDLKSSRGVAVIRFRRGGERCQPKGRSYHHALKKLFQDAGVPPWERNRIPLIYVDEQLVAVWGYWVCG
jgi:tRNA(Ile)-lysidine synthase